jgi:hypothetical protein
VLLKNLNRNPEGKDPELCGPCGQGPDQHPEQDKKKKKVAKNNVSSIVERRNEKRFAPRFVNLNKW